MSVKIAKLVTGEDVIASVTDMGQSYKFKKAVRMIMTERGLGMMPLCPLSKDEEVEIAKSHVVFVASAEDDLANEYNAKFGSGIVVPRPHIGLATP
jgi:hypothetical protein